MQSLFREIICRTHKALIVVEMPKRAGFDSSCATTFSSTVDALGLMEWCKNEINARAEFATQYRLALGKGEPEGGWEEGVDGPDEGGGDSDCTPA